MNEYAPLKPQALVIIDAILRNRPDIAASIIVDGVAFYGPRKPQDAPKVTEYQTDTGSGKKRQRSAKKADSAQLPKARKPRASKAQKAAVSP